ncbi:Mediator of RNA polymerase II transcription subunit 7 [Recurvomyces mirabilis]|uniref:Mediator of RNA polymerase II transcription subunit 7 n=1 Tax=Recurvomyces mirabilis TaxID=574656 RepID=A0AAE1C0E3_9PEZI|nr:Mediator of RNA polymerase II transcription subunit 7 [Recurvomyces mirabilis]KAK5151929.1 Mediator of RNA polymerase II transcription subunit 7 [Recurvomyces mirabilis]
MAEQQAQAPQQERMKAPFPGPPPFYKYFTTSNLSKLRDLRQNAGFSESSVATSTGDGATGSQDVDILALPTELRYLLPPPPPVDGKYSAFGFDRSLHAPPPSLQDVSIEQLYPDHPAVRLNPQAHLISLARSQLTTFLNLIGNLSQDATAGWESPTKDLEILTFNMLDLINQYRPHQARETLIMMMEERLDRMKSETKAISEVKAKMTDLVGGGETPKDTQMEGIGELERKSDQLGDGKKTAQRAAWAILSGVELP